MSDDNTVFFTRKLLKRFIQLYKDQPCLWDKDCISYKLKQKRSEAVDRLTLLVQLYDPKATRVHVLKKIDSLRTCVRREYKRVLESRQVATSEDDVYIPHLWYYKLLSFIFTDGDNEVNSFKTRISPELNRIADETDSEAEDTVDDDEHPFETSMEHNYTADYSTGAMIDLPDNSKRYNNFEDEKSKRHCTEIEDEYDAIGINVAAKLRSLPPNTRILAEKLINDVLFQAQTNALSTATTITTPDPFK